MSRAVVYLLSKLQVYEPLFNGGHEIVAVVGAC